MTSIPAYNEGEEAIFVGLEGVLLEKEIILDDGLLLLFLRLLLKINALHAHRLILHMSQLAEPALTSHPLGRLGGALSKPGGGKGEAYHFYFSERFNVI